MPFDYDEYLEGETPTMQELKETLTRSEVRAAAQKGAEAALLQIISDEEVEV